MTHLSRWLLFLRARPGVVACFVLSALLLGANYFLWQRREAVTLEHANTRRKGEFMLQALTKRSSIETNLAALRDAMAQIDGNLLDERSMEVNLGYFYKFERMTRVRLSRLNQLTALPPLQGSPYKGVPFSMQVTGSYRANMSFIRALETGPRIVRIRHCVFERGVTDNADLVMELTVDVLAKS